MRHICLIRSLALSYQKRDLSRGEKVRGVEIGLECIVYSVDVNPMVLKPVLAGKYNIPNSYVKRELSEVIYSFQIDYLSCSVSNHYIQ